MVLRNSSQKQGHSGPTRAKSVADGCEVSYSEARAHFALPLMKITRVIQKAAMHRSFGLNATVAYLRCRMSICQAKQSSKKDCVVVRTVGDILRSSFSGRANDHQHAINEGSMMFLSDPSAR